MLRQLHATLHDVNELLPPCKEGTLTAEHFYDLGLV